MGSSSRGYPVLYHPPQHKKLNMKPFTVSSTLSLLIMLAIGSSCKKSHPNSGGNNVNPNPATVYVLGSVSGNAMLWKNGVASPLPISINSNALYVSGNDIYVAGYVSAGLWWDGFYTKNGVKDSLPADSAQGSAPNSVFVAGNDVYVAGTQSYNPMNTTTPFTTLTATYPIAGTVASVWKNGVESHLQSYGYPGGAGVSNKFCASYYSDYVSGIQVSGSDVYVAGGSHQYQSGNTASMRFAAYWKNGVPVLLVNGLLQDNGQNLTAWPTTTGIAVSGSDVYVSGYEMNNDNALPTALYWKNGVSSYLSGSGAASSANAITVSGNDVYACGYDNINDTSRAMIWKNGVGTLLPYAPGGAVANSVFVSGTDVYVAGYGWKVSGNYISVYWKNGVLTTLTDGSQPAIANSIYVLNK
jgi:hypothetical protein